MRVERRDLSRPIMAGALPLAALTMLAAAFGAGAGASADPAQARSNVYVASGSTVSVMDTATHTVTAAIPVAHWPRSVAVTPDRAFVYVANDASGTVSVIATATNAVVATVPVGTFPISVAITPDGAFAYVINGRTVVTGPSNTVTVIATATNTVAAVVPVGADPIALAITPDGAFVYVANSHKDVSVIATATNTVVATVPASIPRSVAVSPDGALVYVGSRIDPRGVGPHAVLGILVISTATNSVISTVQTPELPLSIVFTPDGSRAYVADIGAEGLISVIDTATTTVIATVQSPESPPNASTAGMAISPDGAFVYVASLSGNILVIDTATNTVVAVLPGFPGMAAVATTPNRRPVASCGDATVAVGPSCTASASVDHGSFDPDADALTVTQAPAGPYALGATSVTLTATDSFGVAGRCTATVTAIDRTPPAIACPPSVTVKGNLPDQPLASVDPGTATATDNCAVPSLTAVRSDGQPLDAPYPFGTTTITRTAVDASGNPSSCPQTITVVPNTPASKDECKDGGWRTFTNPTFRNQGDCVSFVEHLPS